MPIIVMLFGIVILIIGARGHKEAEFMPYVKEFEEQYHVTTNDITMVFVDTLPHGAAALCTLPSGVIEVKRYYWNYDTAIEKKVTIYHELAHCTLKKFQHRDSLYPDNCPKSILYPSILPESCFIKHEKELLAELNT